MKNILSRLFLISTFLLLGATEALAGPGGKIARSLFDTTWGKIIGIALGVILVPLGLYVRFKEYFAQKSTQKDLKMMAKVAPEIFDEIKLKNTVTDIFQRIHIAWSNQDLSECEALMASWYWQNQQLVYLNQWEHMGLVNVCNVRKILNMKPLHLRLSAESDFEGSRVMYSITANMKDYLQSKSSGKIIEGKNKYREVETVWTFVLENGSWKVENIEEDEFSLYYAKLENIIPEHHKPASEPSGQYSK